MSAMLDICDGHADIRLCFLYDLGALLLEQMEAHASVCM